jgi:integrase/recombinase XerD
MIKHNAKNVRIKHRYFKYLREAKRYSTQSVDGIAQALSRFERHTKHQDFKKFHIEKAVAFKRHLSEQTNNITGKPLSKSTRLTILNALKGFFIWLTDQPGYRSRVSYSDAEYFNLSEKEVRAAKTSNNHPTPTLKQIHSVLTNMPTETDIQLRDRALIAFTILTGSRDGATISLKLKHINLESRMVEFHGRDVSTKYSKSFPTWFFPVGDDVEAMFVDWVKFLKHKKLFEYEEPLFSKTAVIHKPGLGFRADGLLREHWTTSSPVRKIFKQAFELANLPYANPHSFRNTLAQLGEQVCRSPEEFKAWSQNIGHEKVMTTFSSYGAVQPLRQAEIISSLRHRDGDTSDETLLEQLKKIISENSTNDLA